MEWKTIIEQEQKKSYYKKLQQIIDTQYKTKIIFPPKNKIFNAFYLTPIDDLKVVILGQDPYHGDEQAQGLAFSTPSHIKNPPSMQNILKEINNEYINGSSCMDGNLIPWSRQGVLLINTILTVEKGKPKSHKNIGWEVFVNNIIKYISSHCENIIFLLWGVDAIKKQKIINKNKHHILTSVHPSPLSAYRGFFGCNHFKDTNDILKTLDKRVITW
ncbi:Uracil-DNA glycosylase, family 1 [hydrothermal vent metagenome]|uniref:uracil-DNA glycosylase n=1 Tax=hydrothermal vent metagenome TaxID=652676 RepID=A0A3B1E0W4_9ZZZZ